MDDFFSISTEEITGKYRTSPKTFEEKVLMQCNIAGRKTIGFLDINIRFQKILYDEGIYFLDQLEQQTIQRLRSIGLMQCVIEEIESILMVRNRYFHGFREEK